MKRDPRLERTSEKQKGFHLSASWPGPRGARGKVPDDRRELNVNCLSFAILTGWRGRTCSPAGKPQRSCSVTFLYCDLALRLSHSLSLQFQIEISLSTFERMNDILRYLTCYRELERNVVRQKNHSEKRRFEYGRRCRSDGISMWRLGDVIFSSGWQ